MTNEEYDKRWFETTAKFVKVRDALNNQEHRYAYNMAYKQPWKFYLERTAEEAINELIETYENKIDSDASWQGNNIEA